MNLIAAQQRLDESLTPKRRPDLDEYLSSLDPAVLQYMEKLYADEGAAYLPHEPNPSLAIFFAYTMMKFALDGGYVAADDAAEMRDAALQWLEDKQGIRTVSKKKDLPSRGRKMRTRY